MSSSSPDAPRVYLDAEIRPFRSLSRAGFVLTMSLIGVVSFVAGVFYIAIGAWPVMGFFGLDVLLIWLAFRLSYRQAQLVERVRVTADTVELERRRPSGASRTWRLPTYWARVRIDDPVEHASKLELRANGESLVVGAFLAPKERARFAETLRKAIAEAKDERFEGAAAPKG
jgi:uncharacterized membrane protein